MYDTRHILQLNIKNKQTTNDVNKLYCFVKRNLGYDLGKTISQKKKIVKSFVKGAETPESYSWFQH